MLMLLMRYIYMLEMWRLGDIQDRLTLDVNISHQ